MYTNFTISKVKQQIPCVPHGAFQKLRNVVEERGLEEVLRQGIVALRRGGGRDQNFSKNGVT